MPPSEAHVPILSMREPKTALAERLGASFSHYGFATVRDHGIDSGLVDDAWTLTARLFEKSDIEKKRHILPNGHGARGYTAFGTEVAKDAAQVDLKEFWHIGRDLPAGHRLAGSMPPNLWPEALPEFRAVMTRLYARMDAVGTELLSAIALYLGLDARWFDDAIADGNSVLRLLHYPPVPSGSQGLRAAPHEDINLITLLLGAEEAGLEILAEDGGWIAIDPPPGALVVNVGDMLQRLTNNRLPSTTHRVRNPDGSRAGRSRYSMPFFLHPRSDFLIETLPQCVDHDHPDRYREAILADDYLQERLIEIGLVKV